MAMKTAADLIVTALEGITSPTAPNRVQKVPPGHGDDRPRTAKNKSWINLEAGIPELSDEPNKSELRGYVFTAHYWRSSTAKALSDTADILMDMTDALFDILAHNNLGGWARLGIAVDSYESDTEGGEDDDTLYVVRLTFTVWRQEP